MPAQPNAPWYGPLLSLRWRLAVTYSALFGIFVVLLGILLYSSTSNLLLQNAQAAFPAHAQGMRSLLIQDICNTTPPPTPADFLRQNMPGDVDQAYLLDTNGRVVASNNGSLLNQPFPYVSAGTFATAPASIPFTGPILNGTTSVGLLLALQPSQHCLAPRHLPAYLALITSYNDEQNTLRTILLVLSITSVLMIGLATLIISFFTNVIFKPLHQVTRATRALSQGDLSQRAPLLQSKDEIAELAASFNQMADRIQQMFIAQQASERRTQRFVSDASHELRTPITALRGFTEVLLRGAQDDPATVRRILGLMKIEAERMTDLVNDLLTLARLDEGHIPTAGTIDLVDVAVECVQQARKQTLSTGKLSLELASQDRLKIQANSEQIKQMLMALLDNALTYGCNEAQEKVLLRLDKREQRVRLQVIDHGEGIVADDLPHVFERFYRGRNALDRSTSVSGIGLGLSIAQAIAQAYQGSLTVCSNPGKETIFTASFPCV